MYAAYIHFNDWVSLLKCSTVIILMSNLLLVNEQSSKIAHPKTLSLNIIFGLQVLELL